MNIKELIVNKTAKFVYCTDGALWYDVDGFRFPVPFAETVGAYFKPEHKAINLMRTNHNGKHNQRVRYSSGWALTKVM